LDRSLEPFLRRALDGEKYQREIDAEVTRASERRSGLGVENAPTLRGRKYRHVMMRRSFITMIVYGLPLVLRKFSDEGARLALRPSACRSDRERIATSSDDSGRSMLSTRALKSVERQRNVTARQA